MQKLFKNIFLKKFPWRGRKQLESPADFSDSQPKIFRSIFKKKQFRVFAQNFHPKVSIETEIPVLTTPLLFCENWSKKPLSVQKW